MVVFSASLEEPVAWANTTLVRDDAVDAVRAMKEDGSGLISTIGSVSLCRSLMGAGLVDRFRVVMFPRTSGPGPWQRAPPNAGRWRVSWDGRRSR